MYLRKRYLGNGLLIIIVFSSILFYAFSTGITGVTLKNGTGCTCHTASPSSGVNVVIAGPDNLTPGQTGSYTVTITGGPLAAAGTNIAASAGTLSAGAGLQALSGELTHTQPKSPSGGSVVFDFTYTAPATAGQVTLFANGNSVNLNGANSGDAWNFAANKIVNVSTATGVNDENTPLAFHMEQNYPNPFNPSTVITYAIPPDVSGNVVTLKVYDLLGTEVAELVNESKAAGTYRINFDASDLPGGVYIYSLTAGSYSAARKMTLIK